VIENSFKLGRIADIAIGIHYTWLFAFGLVAWSLAGGFFPANYPGWDPATYWLLGIGCALALFGSVLVHELSHSLVARARGQAVRGITLFIFGGISNLETESEEPRDEFIISIVGPLTSFVLAALFWLALKALSPGNSPLGAALAYLALINLLLGGFNLVPGFPLDGGRVLRSIVWAVSGSLRRATDIASFVGQGVGWLLILWGVSRIFGGDFLGGLWIAFIGWFLNNAAEATRQQQALNENLRGISAARLMNPHPPVASPEMAVQEFVFDRVLRQGERAVLVADGRRLLGIVSITDAKRLPQEAWAGMPVREIMTQVPLKTVSADADLNAALKLLVDGTLNQLPVVDDGQVVGLLSRSDILRFLQLRDELKLAEMPRRPSRPAAA
jgi:Zn-dependent protease/CBS domain-containing protein